MFLECISLFRKLVQVTIGRLETFHSFCSAPWLQVFDRENPYLDRSNEYRKQMKNLQWLLGNPFEVFVSLDTGYTQFNEKKNDIVDDALLRDIFYGSVHIAVAFDVLKRFEKGLISIVATLDAQDETRAAAAAAKKTRVQPARQVPAPRPTSPTPRSPKAARKVASPNKAALRGTKRASTAAASRPVLRQKRTPVAGSPSARSANPLNCLAEVAGQKADHPTPSASRGDQDSSGDFAFSPEAPAGAPAKRGNAGSQTSQRSPPEPEATPAGQSMCTASVAGLLCTSVMHLHGAFLLLLILRCCQPRVDLGAV